MCPSVSDWSVLSNCHSQLLLRPCSMLDTSVALDFFKLKSMVSRIASGIRLIVVWMAIKITAIQKSLNMLATILSENRIIVLITIASI